MLCCTMSACTLPFTCEFRRCIARLTTLARVQRSVDGTRGRPAVKNVSHARAYLRAIPAPLHGEKLRGPSDYGRKRKSALVLARCHRRRPTSERERSRMAPRQNTSPTICFEKISRRCVSSPLLSSLRLSLREDGLTRRSTAPFHQRDPNKRASFRRFLRRGRRAPKGSGVSPALGGNNTHVRPGAFLFPSSAFVSRRNGKVKAALLRGGIFHPRPLRERSLN